MFSVGGTKAPSPPVETSFLPMALFKTYLLGSLPFGFPWHLVTAPFSPLSQSDKVKSKSAWWESGQILVFLKFFYFITCGLFVSQVLSLFHDLILPSQTQHYSMRYCHYYPHLTGGETETWRLSDLVRVTELEGSRARIWTQATSLSPESVLLTLNLFCLSSENINLLTLYLIGHTQ